MLGLKVMMSSHVLRRLMFFSEAGILCGSGFVLEWPVPDWLLELPAPDELELTTLYVVIVGVWLIVSSWKNILFYCILKYMMIKYYTGHKNRCTITIHVQVTLSWILSQSKGPQNTSKRKHHTDLNNIEHQHFNYLFMFVFNVQ